MDLSKKMLKFSLTLLLLTIENISGYHNCGKSQHIGGPIPNIATHAPFIANIFQDNQRICEGAIIHRRFIATTANCCHRMNLERVRIRVGSLNDQEGDEYAVCFYIQDPNYNPITKSNDICLIKLVKDLKWTHRIQSAKVPRRRLHSHTKGDIFSWSELPEFHNLLQTDMYTVDNAKCNSHPTASQICLESEHGYRFPCGLESGSPFIYAHKWLYGLASNYLSCDPFETKSMIFTDIVSHKKFIDNVISNHTYHDVY